MRAEGAGQLAPRARTYGVRASLGRAARTAHRGARRSKGERPSKDNLRKYIAQADRDGDGMLDEPEYLELLAKERKKRGAAGTQQSSESGR